MVMLLSRGIVPCLITKRSKIHCGRPQKVYYPKAVISGPIVISSVLIIVILVLRTAAKE